ncbi:hypothetical protein G9A89_020812 [Geosiphon pyriformis]|nr:hypothetical protein G9A89_020812 [Geosiphon pyriformis]
MAAKDSSLVMIAGRMLLADKHFNIALDWIGDLKSETGDRSFDNDFPIMHWTYSLEDATAQSSDELVQDLWHCKVVSLDCLNLVQISMEASQTVIPRVCHVFEKIEDDLHGSGIIPVISSDCFGDVVNLGLSIVFFAIAVRSADVVVVVAGQLVQLVFSQGSGSKVWLKWQ